MKSCGCGCKRAKATLELEDRRLIGHGGVPCNVNNCKSQMGGNPCFQKIARDLPVPRLIVSHHHGAGDRIASLLVE